MNSFKAKITDIKTSGSFSLVSLVSNELKLKSIVIDTPETADYLQLNNEVNVIFKELEASITTQANLPISLQNQISGAITDIQKGQLLARITLQTQVGPITSVITSGSADKLGLTVGQEVYALIKTNELMLSKE
ncbi:TOBE domain-containing protein [uncultured Roseivirga sp.]|uniref:TOBE domain-containing protein n=1 Tax=uncultured Roseivirga sp. TaxID=543088 RepID=UPI000D7A5A47|nr:TOBE domain-containing protein [uncultured Roseivirga sp.]PWL31682.1 MAG: tobe domain protein [Roseivirga sp. XM-24bin3]